MDSSDPNKSAVLHEDLRRGLKERHLQMIALGGCIGVGLFLGSASAIQIAGPSIVLTYCVGGIIIFYVMRALGEVSVEYPVSGAFSAHANMFLGHKTAYITGWTYWFMWICTCMAEITAVGVYVHYWIPDLPQWIPALIALVCMSVVNLIAVDAFGEFEFWFALIKIVTIVAMIVIGFMMIFLGIGNEGVAIGISNLWTNGGFFPNGITGTVLAIVMVMYSYLGIEIIGVAAGEAAKPEKNLPAAIDKVFWRILFFYVLSLSVIMAIYPWNQIGTMGSPFVLTFQKLGITTAAGIINFVVLTAALSSSNSGLFSTGRMLYNLSLQGNAHAIFSKLNGRHIPANGILFSSLTLLIGVVLNYLVPAEVFIYVTSVAAFGAMWTWCVILMTQIHFRRTLTPEQVANLKYPMPHAPYASWFSIAFMAVVMIIMSFDPGTRVAIYVAPAWLIGLLLIYKMCGYGKHAGGGGRV